MLLRRRLTSLSLVTASMALLVSCAQPPKVASGKIAAAPAVSGLKTDDSKVDPDTRTTGSVTDVKSAVHRAVAWNPTILEAVGRIRQQNEAIADARSGYLPSVGGGVDLGLESGAGRGSGPRFNLTASQMIYDFGKVSGRVAAESAIYDERGADFLATTDDVIKATILAAVEILRNEKLGGVAQDQISDVQSIGRLVEARTEKGASTRSDSLQAQARVQAAEATALEIATQKQRWQSALATLLGMSGNVRLRAAFPPALLKACTAAAPDWETVPVVVAAQSRKRQADARITLARAEMLPTIALEASGQFKMWGEDRDPGYLVGLKVKGDLYNGGSFKARQNAARYAAEASQAGIASARFEIQRSWFESSAQIASLTTLVTSLASRQKMMRETRDLYQKQFLDLGTRTLLDVLNADQELHATRFDQINSEFDLYKLGTECAYASGRLREIFDLGSSSGERKN